MKTPLKVSDFSPEDIKMLVDGAQKYLGPLEDPRDEDLVFKRSNAHKQEPNRPLDVKAKK